MGSLPLQIKKGHKAVDDLKRQYAAEEAATAASESSAAATPRASGKAQQAKQQQQQQQAPRRPPAVHPRRSCPPTASRHWGARPLGQLQRPSAQLLR